MTALRLRIALSVPFCVMALLAGALLGAGLHVTILLGSLAFLLGWSLPRPAAPVEEHPAAAAGPEEPEDHMVRLMDALDDPLLLVERNLVMIANRAAIKLLGEHIVGEDIRLAIRHPAAAERLVGRITEGEGPVELVGLGENDRRWELAIVDIDGQRLIRLKDKTLAYTAERMRVDFVANASHELRTPLATLIGFIETLSDEQTGGDVPTRTRFLNIMAGEARRMERLVEDLISLSRIEADKFTTPQQSVFLASLATSARASIEAGATTGRVEVRALKDVKPVIGDPGQLSQLLHNLIGNAMKYSRAGTPVIVSITNAPNNMVRLSVADESEGIPVHHIPRLTERFYSVDPGRSRKLGGTGLGLAIVKHIVERHRGRLDIRSQLGIGTTVTVLLPAALS